jgi:hypothetical protein
VVRSYSATQAAKVFKRMQAADAFDEPITLTAEENKLIVDAVKRLEYSLQRARKN